MKFIFSWVQMVAGLIIALGATAAIPQPTHAQEARFYCGTDKGIPATRVQTAKGDYPIIIWRYQGIRNYGPQRRCQEVSPRFQQYYNNGYLNYVTSGLRNGQSVVCVAARERGDCVGLLFTVLPGQNANQIVRQISNIQEGATDATIRQSDYTTYSEGRSYVNIDELIRLQEKQRISR